MKRNLQAFIFGVEGDLLRRVSVVAPDYHSAHATAVSLFNGRYAGVSKYLPGVYRHALSQDKETGIGEMK